MKPIRRCLVSALLACGLLLGSRAPAQTPPNLLTNGTFEQSITAWRGQKIIPGGSTGQPAPEMVARETVDTNSTAGALRVTIAKSANYNYNSHYAGAVCPLTTTVPGSATLRIRFAAKSVSGAKRLNVAELSQSPLNTAWQVDLTDTWKSYEVFIQHPVATTNALVFNLVAGSGSSQPLENGVFLLDDVEVNQIGAVTSILFVTRGGLQTGELDFDYFKELRGRGFQVDYTNSLAEVTLARLQRYNVVVLFATPRGVNLVHGGPPIGAFDDQVFIRTVHQYMFGGGGVLLFPEEKNIYAQLFTQFAAPIGGIKFPIERIVETNSANVSNLARTVYEIPLAWTNQVSTTSPITNGVTQLWYPIAPGYNSSHSAPLEVNGNWTVAVRGSSSSRTVPVDFATVPDPLPPPSERYQRPGGVSAPPLVATRTWGTSRIAVISQWPQYTLGAGRKWMMDSQVLTTGVGSRPSHWDKLLENTFKWLAAPTQPNGGGYLTTADKLTAPNDLRGPRAPYLYNATWPALKASWSQPAQYAPVFRGLIGARADLSTASAVRPSVAQYAAAARTAGLNFVVFLQPFATLDPVRFEQLKAECKLITDVLMLPGFTIDANTGDHMFFFGVNAVLPTADVLTAGRLFNLQPQNTAGQYLGLNGPSFAWTWNYMTADANFGFYDLDSGVENQKVQDVRLAGMAALRYYQDGVQTGGDLTAQFLQSAGTANPPYPVVINQVTSAAKLIVEAQSNRAMTYVVAPSFARLIDGLRHQEQMTAYNTFVSEGPLIHRWATGDREMVIGSEEFVTQAAIMPAPLEVSASAGLKEIAIYNGTSLFRRIALNGVQTHYSVTLMLNKSVQKNLVLQVTDSAGRKAISFARRNHKDGVREGNYYCSDRISSCSSARPILSHGPQALPMHWVQPLPTSAAGYLWDGAPQANLPLVHFVDSRPVVTSNLGTESGARFNQTAVLEFTDEGATAVSSVMDELFSPDVITVWHAGHTFGPLGGPSRLFSAVTRYREYLPPIVGVPDVGHIAFAERRGMNAGLYRGEITFKEPQSLNSLLLTTNFDPVPPPPGPAPYFAYGKWPALVTENVQITPGLARTLDLVPGDWFAFYKVGATASHVFIVREQPLRFEIRAPLTISIHAKMANHQVAKNQTQVWELASLGFPVDVPVDNISGIVSRLQYLGSLSNPSNMKVDAGTLVSTQGLVDMIAPPPNYMVDVTVPRPTPLNDMTVPLRVGGLRQNWTAGVFQRSGYVLGIYPTGTVPAGTDRYRETGVASDGRAYVPMYVNHAPTTRLQIGHPVVADAAAGSNLKIQVTKLYDSPTPHWHVSVNNPTADPITTTFRVAMPMAGLTVPAGSITIAAGEYRVLLAE